MTATRALRHEILLFYEKSQLTKDGGWDQKFQHESKETDIILQSDKDWFAKSNFKKQLFKLF